MNNTNELLNVLDLAPTKINGEPNEVVLYEEPAALADDAEIDEDLKYARDNLYDILETGTAAVKDLVSIAQQSQHPRAFEVLNAMLKNLADINKDLLEVQQKKKALKVSVYEGPTTVHQHLTLTTTELNRMIDEAQKSRE